MKLETIKLEIMKRVLLHENINLLGEICSDLNKYLPLLKQVQNSY
ncbi:hypothetical protein KU06112801_470008 [Flavobacterium psychrophilum]|nr:hypothetical protein KU06112801_470008 [Flavobacterium psychrophilum]